MGEQQYALEMWRLLDPDNKLIALNELKKRIVSVKSSESCFTHPSLASRFPTSRQVSFVRYPEEPYKCSSEYWFSPSYGYDC